MAKSSAPVSTRKPANDGFLAGLIDQILSDFIKERVDDSLPAIVVSYDGGSIVECKPAIKMLQTDGTEVSRGTLSVPVFALGTSRMSLRFNLKPGDLGWIKANDRDISLFLQSYAEAKPNTLRKHDFSDGVFYPDAMKGMDFEADAIISNEAGTVKTEWFDDRIVHTAPKIEIKGDLEVEGEIVADGEVTAGAAVPATKVGLTTHTTNGVTPGGGISLEPTPGT